MKVTELPKIKLNKDEKLWLQECWNHLRNHDSVETYKYVKIKTLKIISKDFKPWKIDDRLIRDNVEITLQGIIALDEEKEVFKIADKTFSYIKKEILDDADKNEFDLNFIADCINEERRLTRIVFKLFSNEGLSLWNSAGGSKTYGYDHITIGDSSFDTYIAYDSMTEAFFDKQKEILEYKEKKERNPKTRVNHNKTNISEGLFPLEILNDTRGYVYNIGSQASSCYEYGLYDATLVMIRKLIETLIIECFECNSISSTIKDNDGHYFFLSNLIDLFIKNSKWNLSRNTIKSLPKIKKYGDLSAHNRRFSAKRMDIDDIKVDLRIVLEDLIHIIDYKNSKS